MNHTVLLIDDDEAILDIFRLFLTNHHFTVHCARNMEEAKAHLCQSMYSVVVSDLSLGNGEMDGLQVLEYSATLPQKPLIVVCSGSSASEVKEKVLSMGADIFLAKPFRLNLFLETLDDLLANPSQGSWPLGSIEATGGAKDVQHPDCR